MQMHLHGGWTLCQQHDLNPTKTWALNQMKPEESMCEWNEHKGVKHVHKTNLLLSEELTVVNLTSMKLQRNLHNNNL